MRVVSAFVAVWAVAVAVAFAGSVQLACHNDHHCAATQAKNGLYRGTLVGDNGQPLINKSFAAYFPSRSGEQPESVGGFSTDAQGHYCVIWADDDTPFFDEGTPGSIDALWEPLRGKSPPQGCQRGNRGIPWSSARDATSSFRYIAVLAILGLTLLTALAGAIARRYVAQVSGIAFAASGTLLAVIVWV